MIVSIDLLRHAGVPPKTAASWTGPLTAACQANGIDTPRRIAAFLANVSHETAGLARLEESMDYAADRLPALWPSHFSIADGQRMGRTSLHKADQRAIAERAYGGRMGNGPEGCGDGWLFRGRGALQTTGRFNFIVLAKAIRWHGTVEELPAYLGTPEGASQSAAIYWRQAACNVPADRGDIAAVRTLINGGAVGLPEVARIYGMLTRGLGVGAPAERTVSAPLSETDRLNDMSLIKTRM